MIDGRTRMLQCELKLFPFQLEGQAAFQGQPVQKLASSKVGKATSNPPFLHMQSGVQSHRSVVSGLGAL